MALKWTNQQDAELIILRLAGMVKRRITGRVWFGNPEAYVDIDLLAAHATFGTEIPLRLRRHLVWDALQRVPASTRFAAATVLLALRKVTAAYLSRPTSEFVLLTTVSLQLPQRSLTLTVAGSRIVFTRARPARFKLPPDIDEALLPPSDYCWVRVHVSARCATSAYANGLTALDYIRGLWNLYGNRGKTWGISFDGPCSPINDIRLGPTQSLHASDGSLLPGAFWPERGFECARPADLLVTKYAILRKFEKRMRTLIERVGYRNDVADLIVRYCQALDDRDPVGGFLKLWVILEQLVSRTAGAFREIPRRASTLFHDSAYNAIVIQHLQEARNRIVHYSHSPVDAFSLIIQLKVRVEEILKFAITSAPKFANFGEWQTFLDLPGSAEEVKRGIVLRQVAYKWKTAKHTR